MAITSISQSSKRCVGLLVVVATTLSAAAPPSAAGINAQASRAIQQGRFQTAIGELRAGLQRFPNDRAMQFNLGLALLRTGRSKEAIAPLRGAAQDSVLAGQAHFLLGVDFFESKQYAAALPELNGLRDTNTNERVLYMLEESHRRLGHLKDAEQSFHQLITRYPDSPWTHALMGAAYEEQQQPEKAQEEYKLALERDPTMPNVNYSVGYLYFRQGEADRARPWLEKEVARGCHSLANFCLGEIARADKDAPKAQSFYRRAARCDPSNSDAHQRLGMLLETDKRYEEAVMQLREAIRLKPNSGPAHYHLAVVYRAMGRSEASQAEFARVRQIQAAAGQEEASKP